MDDAKKKVVCRWSSVLYHICAAVLILNFFGYIFIWLFYDRSAEEAYAWQRLGLAGHAVRRAYWDFEAQKRHDLTAFLPPTDRAARGAWAQKIAQHWGTPVAVFLKDGRQFEWPLLPENDKLAAAALEKKFHDSDSTGKMVGARDTLGAMEIRFTAVGPTAGLPDSLWRVVTYVGPLNDSLRWGVLYSLDDLWRPFFADIKDAEAAEMKGPGARIDPLKERLFPSVQVGLRSKKEKREFSLQPTLRATLHGEVLYQSSGTDTTLRAQIDTLNGARLEFHISNMDRLFLRMHKLRAFPWPRLILILFLLVALDLHYRWIKKLTAE